MRPLLLLFRLVYKIMAPGTGICIISAVVSSLCCLRNKTVDGGRRNNSHHSLFVLRLLFTSYSADRFQKHPTTMSRVYNSARLLDGRSILIRGRRYKSSESTARLASSLESANSFWLSLRRRAAVALTQSLSVDDKREILEKIGGKQLLEIEKPVNNSIQEDDSLLLKNSIAEAVAQARIEEAQKQEKKWEKDKEAILQEAEKAAMERVASQLRIQKFNQWQEEVGMAMNSSTLEGSTHTLGAQEETRIKHEHPVLGMAYATLGYKSVHLVSAKDLADIPVWEKQRIYRHDRAKAMAQDKLKTTKLGMPGVITLYEVSNLDRGRFKFVVKCPNSF